MRSQRILPAVRHGIRQLIFGIEILALALLVALSVLGFLTFGQSVKTLLGTQQPFTPAVLMQLLDIALLVFILIELLNIAEAFIEGRRVIYTVFEAVMVAVARKIIASGTNPMDLDKAISVSVITITLGITWWLVTHADTRAGSAAQNLRQQRPSPTASDIQSETPSNSRAA